MRRSCGVRARVPRLARRDLVFLADPRFVLEPEFDLYARLEARTDRFDFGWEAFLKADGKLVLRVMARARREFAKTHGLELPPDRRFVERDRELFLKPLSLDWQASMQYSHRQAVTKSIQVNTCESVS